MTEISTRPITPAQVRAIHVALHRHGIDDATYRRRLRDGFGVGSCKQLTRRQASALLASLGRPLPAPPGTPPRQSAPRQPAPKRRTKPPEGVAELPTPAQRQFIEELIQEVNWRRPAHVAYPTWLRQNMGVKRVLSKDQAAQVIEGLKALKHKTNAAGEGDA